jgi:hypothetical protein
MYLLKSAGNVALMPSKKLVNRGGKNKWTRNTVGAMLTEALDKISKSPAMEGLRFHRDDLLDRPVWKSLVDEVKRSKAAEKVSCEDLDQLLVELDAIAAGVRRSA